MFLLDGSGSGDEAQDMYQQRKEFVIQMIKGLNIGQLGVRVGLINFANEATNHFFLNDEYDRGKSITKIQEAPFIGGKMGLYDALEILVLEQFSDEHGDRNGIDDLVFVVSDVSARDPELFVDYWVDKCNQKNITLVPIGMTNGDTNFDEDFVEYIASGNPPVENRNYFLNMNDHTLDIVSSKK